MMNSLNDEKLRLEVDKLNEEIRALKSSKIRSWITTVSIIIGIFVSIVTILQAVHEVNFKNRQLAIESEIRSHQIFLDLIPDRFSGIKTFHEEYRPDKSDPEKGRWVPVRRESYGSASQLGAFEAAVSMAKKFRSLQPIAEKMLRFQIKSPGDSTDAQSALDKLLE